MKKTHVTKVHHHFYRLMVVWSMLYPNCEFVVEITLDCSLSGHSSPLWPLLEIQQLFFSLFTAQVQVPMLVHHFILWYCWTSNAAIWHLKRGRNILPVAELQNSSARLVKHFIKTTPSLWQPSTDLKDEVF